MPLYDEIKHEKRLKLEKLCKKFIDDNHIRCSESIYQTKLIAEVSLYFIEDICNLLGYYEESDYKNIKFNIKEVLNEILKLKKERMNPQE